MNQKEYLEFIEQKCKEIIATVKTKSADYSGTSDVFGNFKESESFGVAPLVGLNLRLSDKLGRIKSFSRSGKLEGESVEDAYLDICGYCLNALAMLHEKKSSKDWEIE